MHTLDRPYLAPLVVSAALVSLHAAARAQSPILTVPGNPGDHMGTAVAGAGDVDGDGLNDIIVGAPGFFSGAVDAGRARVYSATGAVLQSWTGGTGPSGGDYLGYAVAGAGDVNGDGYDDVIVGAPNDDSPGYVQNGSATVYSGRTGGVLFIANGVESELHLGFSVAGAGDVNGDGFDDVIIGCDDRSNAPNGGVATVRAGPTGAPLFTWGLGAYIGGFGYSVAGAGDVNGDGRPDILVGAPYDNVSGSMAGRVWLFSGANGSPLFALGGGGTSWQFGRSVAGAGDVTGDGRPDILVGAPYGWITTVPVGVAQVFDGVTQALVWSWAGVAADDELGWSVASAGDLDLDGRADLLVGMPGDDTVAYDGGGVRAYSGRSGQTMFTFRLGGAGARCGAAVAGVGNASGAYLSEVAFGAPNSGIFGVGAGLVWLYSPPAIYSYCSGDGSATACPCGPGGVGRGCPNSAESTGATLQACGTPSVSADTASLFASDMPMSVSLFFQGTTRTNGGAGGVFGDGLVCAGGSTIRLATKMNAPPGTMSSCVAAPPACSTCGAAQYPQTGDPAISTNGQVPALGGTRHYQVWYRNGDPTFCTSSTFNLTNGVTLIWGP